MLFFKIKKKISLLFTFFILSTFASNSNTFSYSLINKFKVYSLKFASEFRLDSSSFSFFSNSHWLLFVFCEIFLEKVIANLRISYLSNSHFIWSVCSDSDSCCCLIFSINCFICLTKSALEIRELLNFPKPLPFPLFNSFRLDIEQKTGEWSVERTLRISDLLTYFSRFCEMKMESHLCWIIQINVLV